MVKWEKQRAQSVIKKLRENAFQNGGEWATAGNMKKASTILLSNIQRGKTIYYQFSKLK